jgi:NitT/TauT family transport system permease protein
VLAIAVGAVIWEILGRADVSLLVPPVTSIAAAWWTALRDGSLLPAALVSLRAFAMGFTLALAIGLPLGFLIGRYRTVRVALSPFVNALMSTPHIAVVPLILLWVGTGQNGRVLAVFLFTFIPLLVNVEEGVRNVETEFLEMARVFGANERQLLWTVVLPDSMPLVLAGIRLSIGRAVKGMVTGEIILASAGLGKLLLLNGQSLAADRIYSIVITIVAVAIALAEGVRLLERRLLSWKGELS